MLTLLRFIGRRLTNGRLQQSRWFRRFAIGFAIVRWLNSRMSRPQVIYLRNDEALNVEVVKKGSKGT